MTKSATRAPRTWLASPSHRAGTIRTGDGVRFTGGASPVGGGAAVTAVVSRQTDLKAFPDLVQQEWVGVMIPSHVMLTMER